MNLAQRTKGVGPPTPGALLDLDGTLVDSNYQHAIAWFRAFRGEGVVVPLWRIDRHVGTGGDQLVEAVAGSGSRSASGIVCGRLNQMSSRCFVASANRSPAFMNSSTTPFGVGSGRLASMENLRKEGPARGRNGGQGLSWGGRSFVLASDVLRASRMSLTQTVFPCFWGLGVMPHSVARCVTMRSPRP